MIDDNTEEGREMRERINRQFEESVPHNRALGLELLELDNSKARGRLPWAEHFVGNPETGVIHGGVITSILDACCGAAVFQALAEPTPIATLDLRIDYMKPATPKTDVLMVARVTKVTRNVAFVRATAYHDDENDPIAMATATFMIGTHNQRREKKNREEGES
jgi:uncharacterized protein (TIGR00369 family)